MNAIENFVGLCRILVFKPSRACLSFKLVKTNRATDKFYFTNSTKKFKKIDDLSCDSIITVFLTIIHSFLGALVKKKWETVHNNKINGLFGALFPIKVATTQHSYF